MNIDLNDRLFKFAVDVVIFLRTIKNNQETGMVKYQLTKAATSIEPKTDAWPIIRDVVSVITSAAVLTLTIKQLLK